MVKLLIFGKCRPRPLNLGALQMEGGGGVTFLKLPFVFALSTRIQTKLISDLQHHEKVPSCEITSNARKATKVRQKTHRNHGGQSRRAHHAVC